MNLSYLSFYSQYINSPITKFHKINLNKKILTTFISLFILPYINNIYKIYLLSLILDIGFSFKNMNTYIYIFIIIYYIYIYTYLQKKKTLLFSYTFIYLPIKIKTIFLNQNNYIIQKIVIKFNIFLIPKFLTHIIIISFIYIKTISLLLKNTKYELIILFFLKFLKYILLIKPKHYYNFILVLSLTSQFLQRIINNLNIIFYAIQLKFTYWLKLSIISSIFDKIINKYILTISQDSKNLSSNLWIQELQKKSLKNI
uniref:Ycf92 n=1 Tax=Dasya binghamiae TaxID=1896963 RepID=A0A1C8XS83_9FLOR|nr:Ycf92 [Dasya binghamiae]AOH77349.1 Ycf92 [Dasya binghamiae]